MEKVGQKTRSRKPFQLSSLSALGSTPRVKDFFLCRLASVSLSGSLARCGSRPINPISFHFLSTKIKQLSHIRTTDFFALFSFLLFLPSGSELAWQQTQLNIGGKTVAVWTRSRWAGKHSSSRIPIKTFFAPLHSYCHPPPPPPLASRRRPEIGRSAEPTESERESQDEVVSRILLSSPDKCLTHILRLIRRLEIKLGAIEKNL